MCRYYFDLVTRKMVTTDPDGTELSDDAAARVHAEAVVKELLQGREVGCRSWRLAVSDDSRRPLFDVLFASVDHSLDHLEPSIRDRVETLCATASTLGDTMREVDLTLRAIEARRQRTAHRPYLASYNGSTISQW